MTTEALLAGSQGHHPKVASLGEGAHFSSSGVSRQLAGRQPSFRRTAPDPVRSRRLQNCESNGLHV